MSIISLSDHASITEERLTLIIDFRHYSGF